MFDKVRMLLNQAVKLGGEGGSVDPVESEVHY